MVKRDVPFVRRSACAGALLTALALGGPARALQIDHGDLVGVFVKNNVEVIVNMGPVAAGRMLDLSGVVDIAAFDDSVAGAKFVGLAVEDPGRTVNCCGGSFPQANVFYTSEVVDPMPTDSEIDLAMRALDEAGSGSTAWFHLLRQLPGTDSEVVQASELFSYTTVLGLGTDAIANNFTFSTAGSFDDQGVLTIPIYSAVYGYDAFGGPPTEYLEIAQLEMDGTDVTMQVPEPAAALNALAGALVLVCAARVRSGAR